MSTRHQEVQHPQDFRPGRLGQARARACTTRPANSATSRPTQQLGQIVTELDAEYQAGGNMLFYLADAAVGLRPDLRQSRQGRLQEARPGWKRIIVEKPFGTDLPSAQELNKRDPLLLGREPDLPHRPLPRQGDGAEHPGLPFLQRHVRAALEQAAHRPHPVHRVRDRSASRGAAATTTAPACSAT